MSTFCIKDCSGKFKRKYTFFIADKINKRLLTLAANSAVEFESWLSRLGASTNDQELNALRDDGLMKHN